MTKEQGKYSVIHQYFDEVYLINTFRGQKIWDTTVKRLNDVGIIPMEMPSFNDEFNEHSYKYRELKMKFKLTIPSIKEYVRLLTHKSIIEQAMINREDKILILEDGLILHKSFHQYLSNMNFIVDKWGLVFLGHQHINVNNVHSIGEGLSTARGVYGSFAYGVEKSLYEPLLSLYNQNLHTVEESLMNLQEMALNESFCYNPPIIIREVKDQYKQASKSGWCMVHYNFVP